MFFDDLNLLEQLCMPPVPSTMWVKPTEFPNLSSATKIAIDCETKELDLDNGPGWGRGKGHIVGVSIAASSAYGDKGKWYFPVRHEVEPEDNLEPYNVFGWLKSVLGTDTPKVFANALYDAGWLTTEDVSIKGYLHDVQFAEALLDEESLVNLDSLSNKYLGTTKNFDTMYKWLEQAYPKTPKSKIRGNIYRCPPRLVGPYAEDDADLPLRILPYQLTEIEAQGLSNVYKLECSLIPLIVRMRLEGVSVDIDAATRLKDKLTRETTELYDSIRTEYGYHLLSTDSRQLKSLFNHIGIKTPLTEQGNPSVNKEWLSSLNHPIGHIIRSIREREKLCGTFIQSYILDKNVNGKIYPQFHPLKGDNNGAKVGRFASSTPNLQNIPSRTVLGKAIRRCFIPDMGHSHWCKLDYSQIHYRILAHYAVGPGSDQLRSKYCNDKTTDYHQNVLESVAPLLGWDINDKEHNAYVRRPIKNMNFGLLYGQSLTSLMSKTKEYFGDNFTKDKADSFFKAYFDGATYVRPTMKMIEQEVQQYGFTTSILGRRCRFNLWENASSNERLKPLTYPNAINEYGFDLKRAYGYRGVNYKFQSSEPDIMKTGMLHCLESGVFDYTGVPRLTVHDELDFSVKEDTPLMKEAFEFIKRTMEQAVELKVPLLVDMEQGLNWGDVG